MPFEHHWHEAILYKRFHGELTTDEFMLSIQLTQGDARFGELEYSVNDFVDATLPELSESQFMTFAAYGVGAGITNSAVELVVITSSAQLQALAQRYARLTPFGLRVFASRQEAAAALPEVMAARPSGA